MMFHFMDGLQNWARTELEQRQVSTIDEAITQVEALMDLKHDKGKAQESKGGHDKGGGDQSKGKEQQPPRSQDRADDKKFGR